MVLDTIRLAIIYVLEAKCRPQFLCEGCPLASGPAGPNQHIPSSLPQLTVRTQLQRFVTSIVSVVRTDARSWSPRLWLCGPGVPRGLRYQDGRVVALQLVCAA